MKTILAPIDFSDVTDAVIATATSLARALKAKVVLMTVVQPPAMMADYAPLMENIAEVTSASEKTAARQLAKCEKQLHTAGVTAESMHLVGASIPAIVDQAEKVAADYIVMGSHGHTALYDLLVGSTTHGVLVRAKCPVVIAPMSPSTKPKKAKKPFFAFA